jgi:hypothetical protein
MRPLKPIRFTVADGGVELDEQSLATVRAMARELNRNQEWIVLVGANPAGAGTNGEQLALNKSFAIVFALRSLTHRDDLAESVSWGAVAGVPGARADGVGFLLLAPGGK